MSHLLQQTSLTFQLRAALYQSSFPGPTKALLERPRDHSENNPWGFVGEKREVFVRAQGWRKGARVRTQCRRPPARVSAAAILVAEVPGPALATPTRPVSCFLSPAGACSRSGLGPLDLTAFAQQHATH